MRLGDILSRPISGTFEQVEPFIRNKKYSVGKDYIAENIGTIARTYFCKSCNMARSFCYSNTKIRCTFINERSICIHMVLKCIAQECKSVVPIWCIVEADQELTITNNPKVRLFYVVEKLNAEVAYEQKEYGRYIEFLQKAELAFRSELGAGALIYLRKTFEGIAHEVAESRQIDIKNSKGNNLNFREILKRVDEEYKIIPQEFSANGYKLFGELSDLVHGGSIENEEIALKKYPDLKRLVIGILEKVKNNVELLQAVKNLNWNNNGEQNEQN